MSFPEVQPFVDAIENETFGLSVESFSMLTELAFVLIHKIISSIATYEVVSSLWISNAIGGLFQNPPQSANRADGDESDEDIEDFLKVAQRKVNRHYQSILNHEYIKSKIAVLYEKENPTKVNDVDGILLKYKNNLKSLFANLRKKYGNDALIDYKELKYPSLPTTLFEIGSISDRFFISSSSSFCDGLYLPLRDLRTFINSTYGIEFDDGALLLFTASIEAVLESILEFGRRFDVCDHNVVNEYITTNNQLFNVFKDDLTSLYKAACAVQLCDRGPKVPAFISENTIFSDHVLELAQDAISNLNSRKLLEIFDYPQLRAPYDIQTSSIEEEVQATKLRIVAKLPTTPRIQAIFTACINKMTVGTCLPISESFAVRDMWETLHDTVMKAIENYPDNSWIQEAGRIANLIPVKKPNSLKSIFNVNFVREFVTCMAWCQHGDDCATEEAVSFVERACIAGADVEGDLDCGRTALLWAGPKTAEILLSYGANPQFVIVNKDFPQELSVILDWGVSITSVISERGEEVEGWQDMLKTKGGRKAIATSVRYQEWEMTTEYAGFKYTECW